MKKNSTEKKTTEKRTAGRKVAGQKADKSILFVTYIMVGLFVGLMGYFGYFLQVQSETVINNSYNARLDSFSDRIIRGEILSNDGTVLAKTNVAEDGTEVREYPYGSLFAHVVGYSDQGKTGLESLANFYLLSSHMNLVEPVSYTHLLRQQLPAWMAQEKKLSKHWLPWAIPQQKPQRLCGR